MMELPCCWLPCSFPILALTMVVALAGDRCPPARVRTPCTKTQGEAEGSRGPILHQLTVSYLACFLEEGHLCVTSLLSGPSRD